MTFVAVTVYLTTVAQPMNESGMMATGITLYDRIARSWVARISEGFAEVGFPFFRHRPACPGDPISFLRWEKLDRADKPGDDDY